LGGADSPCSLPPASVEAIGDDCASSISLMRMQGEEEVGALLPLVAIDLPFDEAAAAA